MQWIGLPASGSSFTLTEMKQAAATQETPVFVSAGLLTLGASHITIEIVSGHNSRFNRKV
jgi:hypothetical protein